MTDRIRYATYWALIPWLGFSGLMYYNHKPLSVADALWMILSYPVFVFIGRYIYDAKEHDRKKREEAADARANEHDQ